MPSTFIVQLAEQRMTGERQQGRTHGEPIRRACAGHANPRVRVGEAARRMRCEPERVSPRVAQVRRLAAAIRRRLEEIQ